MYVKILNHCPHFIFTPSHFNFLALFPLTPTSPFLATHSSTANRSTHGAKRRHLASKSDKISHSGSRLDAENVSSASSPHPRGNSLRSFPFSLREPD